MASYAAVASLLNFLNEIIYHRQYPPTFFHGREQLQISLHERFSFLEEIVQDISPRGFEVVGSMEALIRDAAYIVQDIIENQISVLIECEEKTQDMQRKLISADLTQDDTILEQSRMVGFDKDLHILKDQLCTGPDKLKVISIVGMAGIGKTVLARTIFDENQVMSHFVMRIWITVSQNYNSRRVFEEILNSLGLMVTDLGDEHLIYSTLKNTRYLIVIDDVWDKEVWFDLKRVFPDNCNGSRIVLTTGSRNVAREVYDTAFSYIHEMQFRNHDECWNLLSSSLFPQGECHPKLELIGKYLLSKYNYYAKILSNSTNPGYWGNFVMNLIDNGESSHPIFRFQQCYSLRCLEQQYIYKNHISRMYELEQKSQVDQMEVVSADTVLDNIYHKELEMVKQQVDSFTEKVAVIKPTKRTQYSTRWKSYYSSGNVSSSQNASIGGNSIVGFVKDVEILKGQLLEASASRRLISIVGAGGIGKTTLAKYIYDDAQIVNYFHKRAWVTISEHFIQKNVLIAIQNCLGIADVLTNSKPEKELGEILYQYLKARRYLLVIDDMGSTNFLNDLELMMPDNFCGSRIIITTRSKELAQEVHAFVHEMQYLDLNERWKLLKNKVFSLEKCPFELEVSGKCIARSCEGLPIAIVTVAGMLSQSRDPRDWENIATMLSETDGSFLTILSFSYNHLPPQLKACLLYIGRFPKKYEISVFEITKLWVAEGFVKSFSGFNNLEKVAEQCLWDLVKRNLVQVTKTRFNCQLKYCTLHDLINDFCSERACIERSELVELISVSEFIFSPHFQISFAHHLLTPISIPSPQHLPTFSFFSIKAEKFLESDQYPKLLRVMVLSVEKLQPLPEAILRMFHLKFLGFIVIGIPENQLLSSSISKFQNLQTLVLYSPQNMPSFSLPSTIWHMKQLRHLIVIPTMTLPLVPMDIQPSLDCLQTLKAVKNISLRLEVVAMIPNLKRLKLQYERFGEALDWKFFHFDNLIRLVQLKELAITFNFFFTQCVGISPNTIAFPLNLKQLSLRGGRLPWTDLTVVGSLPNLKVLKLKCGAFVGEEWKPVEGQFLCLKFLQLDRLDLKHWKADHTHFPCLEYLRIKDCQNLRNIPPGIADIRTLRMIEVINGSQSLTNSVMTIQEISQIFENTKLQFRVRR